MSDDISDVQKLELLFGICRSKEELQAHIKAFLKVDLPHTTIDEDSTSNPLQFVWDVYSYITTGKGCSRHVAAASRNSYKTLCTSIIQFYSLVHCRRDSVQISALLEQSASAISYVDKFLRIPILSPYTNTDNARTKSLKNLPPNELTKRPEAVLRVVTATKSGANSQRASTLIFDETDLTPREVIAEAVYIADVDRYTGFDPVSIYISSRKSNSGPLQDLIDEASTGSADIKLHKWSAVDVSAVCPPEVYNPMLPENAYLNTNNLQIIWSDKSFNVLTTNSNREIWKKIPAYEGCKTCPAFIACQARAPRQTSTAKTLRSRSFVGKVLKDVRDPSTIIAQTLNWRPDLSSVVFNVFAKYRNVKNHIDLYKWICGYYFNPNNFPKEDFEKILNSDDPVLIHGITPTKKDIFNILTANGWKVHYGVDWGMYDPAIALIVAYHRTQKRAVVLHIEASTGYANPDWAKFVYNHIWSEYPGDLVCPDMADPGSPTYFTKFRIPCRDKKPMKIETGVAQVKSLLFNPFTQTEHLAILDDGEFGQNQILIEAMEKWTYKKTAIGFDYTKYEDNEYTHTLDALRYALDPFVEDAHISLSVGQSRPVHSMAVSAALGDKEALEFLRKKQEIANVFKESLQMEHGVNNPFSIPAGLQQAEVLKPQLIDDSKPIDTKGKKGPIKFSF